MEERSEVQKKKPEDKIKKERKNQCRTSRMKKKKKSNILSVVYVRLRFGRVL